MKMEAVEVYANKEGQIVITQPCHGGDDSVIVIAPEQIDVLSDWLKKTRDEVLSVTTA